MRFTSRSNSRELLVELTPMIDVVFLLIIFFMVTAEFARNVRAEVELPRLPGEQSQQTEEAGVVINIDADGRIILHRRVALIESAGELHALSQSYVPGLVHAPDAVHHAHRVPVLSVDRERPNGHLQIIGHGSDRLSRLVLMGLDTLPRHYDGLTELK